jgi:hypothetical protein
MLIQVLVFSLLWGAMAFALHTHHDELEGSDSECQICLFGLLSGSSVPVTVNTLIPILTIATVCELIPQIVFITRQVRIQEARAPPMVIS